jgi:hypothetical protein
MLSDNIDALRASMAAYSDTGMVLEAPAVTNICMLLASFSHDARQLEQAVVPAPVRLTGRDLPENVVRLAEKLHRQGVRVGVPSGGGDAA